MGKLNHTNLVIPTGGFFLTRLRYRLIIENKWGMQNLIKWGKEYLYLWLLLLIQATDQGIDIHHINSSIPLLFFISDAIKRVIGGFNSEVIAWCFEFPLSMQGIFFLGILELIAAKITIYITLKVLQVKK